jgi:hypothetical protein
MDSEMDRTGMEEVSTELLISAYWRAWQLELDLSFIKMIGDELLHRGIQINLETE